MQCENNEGRGFLFGGGAAGKFCHLRLVSNTKSYKAFKAKGKDFGLKDQGQ